MSDQNSPPHESAPNSDANEPSLDELQEPSTEKEPGQEPVRRGSDDAEPSHEAVGIGVIGRPQTETGETSDDD